jgi:hypothetical protein
VFPSSGEGRETPTLLGPLEMAKLNHWHSWKLDLSKEPKRDRLCGLVVTVPGYRSRGPGSIPGATRFSEMLWVWNGVHSAS